MKKKETTGDTSIATFLELEVRYQGPRQSLGTLHRHPANWHDHYSSGALQMARLKDVLTIAPTRGLLSPRHSHEPTKING